MMPALALMVLVATLALAAPGGGDPGGPPLPSVSVAEVPVLSGLAPGLPGRREPPAEPAADPAVVPSRRALREADAYAKERGGAVSFATVDSSGRLEGHDADRLYSAASVVKAMVLAAELRRL